eukprot:jgi/Orpsp1_1/1189815/evm.model.d7180000074699.1
MRFFTLAALLATAATAFADNEFCGHKCDPSKVPSTPLSGKLELVAIQDKDNPAINYKIGGNIVIINDCKFRVENFYMFPAVNVAKWMGAPIGATNGIGLTQDGAVSAIDPNQPQTLEYDVSEVNPFCEVSLLDNVGEFRLVDTGYQLLARATVNPAVTPETSSAANKKSSDNASSSSTSDANTSKWSMALLGLTAAAGYLLA